MKKSIVVHIFILIIAICSAAAQDVQNIELANQYYQQGDVDKAITLYESLAKDPKNVPFIHNNFFQLLLNTAHYSEAGKYINKRIKTNKGNVQYEIEKGLIFERQNQKDNLDKYFAGIITRYAADQYKVRVAAQHMVRNNLYEYAEQLYLASRKELKKPTEYAIQLASIYRVQNKKQFMVEEYLNFAQERSGNINYVKNALQNVLTEPEDLDDFETFLIDKVQRNPNNQIFSDLLVWVNIQQKDFYAAFIQVRAVDKRNKLGGRKLIEIGKIALDNKDYDNSIKCFQYVVDQYPETPNYQISKRYLIKTREEKVKNTYPVNLEEIKTLIADYDLLLKEIGLNQYTVEALQSKAMLHAFYLNDNATAIEILEQIINYPRMNPTIVSESKLNLGDIHLLISEPWEATLLYSQVEKSNKETILGYEAKLRNAKLSYYKGDFSLAVDRLDILKEATTREISNDAMKLSLLIKDNTVLDTSDFVMQQFAYADLLVFQQNKQKALDTLNYLLETYPQHGIIDEVQWQMANINLEQGNYETAVTHLDKIIEGYAYDILADDAIFLKAEIQEQYLKDASAAMETYQKILTDYKGSIYSYQARKRFRTLRGDFSN